MLSHSHVTNSGKATNETDLVSVGSWGIPSECRKRDVAAAELAEDRRCTCSWKEVRDTDLTAEQLQSPTGDINSKFTF